ncbi:hypothetical protein LMG24238_04496 [Paraburkholderia sediminicola]|uniref:GmrSD restriction endonucleases N-terminal domain-containing protein n=1 Tax=Paraburkholderia sediminicola TaxID=458836 RepID=A0A6J5BRG9_9BURK|nr:DUF262 domain-containing protein [Paraburkholderia sediminicola]CAB3715693.1 hypothetical protein LMG24238_04496 [Paraburkholderia sediminicola]
MGTQKPAELEFDDEFEDQDVSEALDPRSVAAVVSGNDWTTETIVSQLERKNIQLSPGFQRRDAWKKDRKSRFIESLIVGLPIPQIVLAEVKTERGKFIVLDGKQRLLSILQFWGKGAGENNGFALSSLTLREDLKRKTFEALATDPSLESDYNALCNQPIRTVVIRNWRDTNFLHTVFLRLNTGSVKLSPQELRQALQPGAFSTFIDEAASNSMGIKKILGLTDPDPRMRDIEILARFLAFRFFAPRYPGRLKAFLDYAFETFNEDWDQYEPKIVAAISEFEAGVSSLSEIFGDTIARKPDSRQFNRAVFDALIYFQSKKSVRAALAGKGTAIVKSYKALFAGDSRFLAAVESDTAGAGNTFTRLQIWAAAISEISGADISPPLIPNTTAADAGAASTATKNITAKKVPAKAAPAKKAAAKAAPAKKIAVKKATEKREPVAAGKTPRRSGRH